LVFEELGFLGVGVVAVVQLVGFVGALDLLKFFVELAELALEENVLVLVEDVEPVLDYLADVLQAEEFRELFEDALVADDLNAESTLSVYLTR